MTDVNTEKTVTRNDDEGRYEIRVGDEFGGYSEFEPGEGGRVVFPHTEVDPAFAGQGLGSVLVGEALADIARRGEIVVPECSFIVHYLKENDVPGLVVDWPKTADAADSADPAEPA